MCSITGSFNKNIFDKLTLIGYNRGNFSYSLTEFEIDKFKISKSFEPINTSLNKIFYLGHSQAPTNGLVKNFNRIHPSECENNFLYHNGILKYFYIEKLKSELDELNEDWDTKLLLVKIIKNGFDSLSEIDGSFTCVFFNNFKFIYLFRNEIAPLWIDNDFNFSSIKFENSKMLDSNKIFKLDLQNKKMETVKEFITKNNPYLLTK